MIDCMGKWNNDVIVGLYCVVCIANGGLSVPCYIRLLIGTISYEFGIEIECELSSYSADRMYMYVRLEWDLWELYR